MKALLDLIDTKEDAIRALAICTNKNVTITHRSYTGKDLNKEVIRSGGFDIEKSGGYTGGCAPRVRTYNAFLKIGLGAKFGNRWKITGFEDPDGKPFTGLKVHFAGDVWARPVEEQTALVQNAGGEVVAQPDRADIIVLSEKAPVELELRDAALAIKEVVFQRVLPAKQVLPAKRLAKDAAALWKLLSSRDEASIRQGLSLAAALENGFDDLLEGVEVNPATGEVIRSKRFSGTRPALPFLDVALYGLLSVAPEGSRAATLRAAVRKIQATVALVPELAGFDALVDLKLVLVNAFKSPNLEKLGSLPALKTLSITREKEEEYRRDSPILESLTGLDAPVLESLIARQVDLKDAGGPFRCASLKFVDLSHNRSLARIDGLAASAASLTKLTLESCRSLSSLDPISGATALRRVILKNSGVKSLQALSGCAQIDELTVEDCSELVSLNGLACKPLVGPKWHCFSLSGCSALKSLEGLPKMSSSIFEALDISDLENLADLSGIEAIPGITILNASHCVSLTSLAGLEAMTALESIHLPVTITDASAILQRRDLKVKVDVGRKLTAIPQAFGQALAELQNFSLMVAGSNLKDCSALGALKAVESIKLDDCRELEDLTWITGLAKLKKLEIPVSSRAYEKIGSCRWTDSAEVRKLQQAICAENKLPLPPHLKE